MRHSEGDIVKPRHCILLASGHRKKDLPFVAKVTALYENPEDGECSMTKINFHVKCSSYFEIH